MHCTKGRRHRLALLAVSLQVVAWLAACGHHQAPVASPPQPTTAEPALPSAAPGGPGAADAADPPPPVPPAVRPVRLPAPATPRSMNDLQLQFAQRLVAAHPEASYTERAPDRLWAIPVLEVELHADGSVRRITVLRKPTTGNEATALAIAAVRRAAPFGDVSRLPRPWKVVETFLFDDRLRFKPRTLDLD